MFFSGSNLKDCLSTGCQEGVGDGMICHAVGSIWEEHHYDGCFKKQCYVDQATDKYTTTTVGAGKLLSL